MGSFIIAEAGVNHNGSEELALQLAAAAAAAGADAVKFQTFKADSLVKPGAAKAAYQAENTGAGDQLSMLRALELTEAMHESIHARCQEHGIAFMSTPFDTESADFLVGLGMGHIKVPSGEITNIHLLKHLASKDLPLIISTGMASLDEVAEAVNVVQAVRDRHGFEGPLSTTVTLLHCTSNYPTAFEDVNLRAMTTLAQAFGLPVGYSDHTAGILVPAAAVAMGATVIEKHFTLDRRLPGPDHQASLEPDELARMVRDIRAVEACFGSGEKIPRPSELPVRDLVRRSVTLVRAVGANEVLKAEDLALLRPGTGIPPRDVARLIGRKVRDELPAGTTLQWADLL